MIKRPKTVDQYVELVKQAVFEVEELRLATEYDLEQMGGVMTFLDNLEEQVKGLWDSMVQGTYEFRDEDLPFMRIVNTADDRLLPFKFLLRVINETHRKGLDVDEV
ncbi:MAG: hypothetical protein WC383_01220 [Gammaproteobacteria bacterium]